MSNKKDNIEIESISQYYLEKINKYKPYIPIFRGQANKDWKIKSTFDRRTETTKATKNVAILFDQYHRDLINDAKHHRYSQEKDLNDLEILAEIQHFGGATGLIDFSKNALIALFFACQPHKEKEKETDGKVFIMDTINLDEKLVSPKKDDDEIKKILEDIKHKTLYIENIYKSNNRIFAQQGVFLFGGKIDSFQEIMIKRGILKEVIIKQKNKRGILKELDKIYGINNDFLFQDIHGFSTINNTNYPIVKTFKEIVRDIRSWKNTDDIKKIKPLVVNFDDREKVACYFLSAIAKGDLRQYKEAIEDYDEAIKLNSKFAEAYNNRGIAKSDLGQYEKAIKDYDEAIKLNPKFAKAYNNRGFAKSNLGQYEEAREDCNEAIKLNPKYAEAYYNRGVAKGNLGQHEEAIEDYNKALELFKQQNNQEAIKVCEENLRKRNEK